MEGFNSNVKVEFKINHPVSFSKGVKPVVKTKQKRKLIYKEFNEGAIPKK
jgi:hypothetical protein